MNGVVIIEPRRGITARQIAHFLTSQFQTPGQCDGNPLINACITYTGTDRDPADNRTAAA